MIAASSRPTIPTTSQAAQKTRTSARLSRGADPLDEASVGRHDPLSQPTTPGFCAESGEELRPVELVGVDGFSVKGLSFLEGDPEEASASGLNAIGIAVIDR